MKSLTSVIFKNSRRRIVIANKKENILGALAFFYCIWNNRCDYGSI